MNFFNWFSEVIDDWTFVIENWADKKQILATRAVDFVKDNYIAILIIVICFCVIYEIILLGRKWAIRDVVRRWNEQEDNRLAQYKEAVDQPMPKYKVRKERYRWDLPREEAMKRWNSHDNIIEVEREEDGMRRTEEI